MIEGLMWAPIGLSSGFDKGFFIYKYWTKLISRFILYLMELFQTMEDLMEVLMPCRRRGSSALPVVIGVKVLHFEYNNNK
jgi:hypothetical protein